MGTTHSLVPNRCWDDGDDDRDDAAGRCNAIDAFAAVASLAASETPTHGTPHVDADVQTIGTASKAEYKHNQEAIYEAIVGLPSSCTFCIGVVYHREGDGGGARAILGIVVECRGGDRYAVITSGPTSRGWPVWPARLLARAVSALCLSHVVYVVPTSSRRTPLDPAIEARFVGLRDRMWVPTLVRGLFRGPACGGWTSDSITQMRLAISLVERATTQRIQNAQEPMHLDAATAACAAPTRDAARCLCESDHVVHVRGPFAESCLDHAAGIERDLRWMAVWLDALEQTPAVSACLMPCALEQSNAS
ncbi:hypothetical protein pneo_cds_121 [Pandoravirus neocaledonia]|uniref:Uncharacterized protein n=1 Tax=Pandoravirus neocaledonia TaxID=2107708 RepID=A0A2U7UB97_9VIRU|nr:hypothetical protein pneo_cds_121 [Pandoravirus neocaledonia]AVK75728.1 hypothetical protein pneo_cds_121 [Pandoravirus neocaledonia]